MNYFFIFLILIAAELVYFQVAHRFDIVDRPNARSSHHQVTPRGGGIIFPISVAVWALFFGLHYPWFVLGLLLIATISFADDVKPVANAPRLVIHFIAMFLMFYNVGLLTPQTWWMVFIAMIVCVGILNAFNFMDGINGITGGYSIAVLLPLLLLNTIGLTGCPGTLGFIRQDFLLVILLAVLVFCWFNFRTHARCFAGDVGAVSIAFILVFAIGKLMMQTKDVSYILLLAVYGVDTVLTIVHRILLHENLGVAHRKHAYQIMANELHIPHVVVSLLYAGLQLLIAAGLLFLPVNHYLYMAVVLVILGFSYLLFMKKYYPLHDAYLKSLEK